MFARLGQLGRIGRLGGGLRSSVALPPPVIPTALSAAEWTLEDSGDPAGVAQAVITRPGVYAARWSGQSGQDPVADLGSGAEPMIKTGSNVFKFDSINGTDHIFGAVTYNGIRLWVQMQPGGPWSPESTTTKSVTTSPSAASHTFAAVDSGDGLTALGSPTFSGATVADFASTAGSGGGLWRASGGVVSFDDNDDFADLRTGSTGGSSVSVSLSDGRTATLSVSVNGVAAVLQFTSAPAITGTQKVGSTLTMAYTATGEGAITPTFVWRRDGSVISGATSATYTLVDADDGALISGSVALADSIGSIPAVDADAVGPITYPAPVAAGALADQSYALGSGSKTVNAATDFTGAVGGSWSVSGPAALSPTINSSGVVTLLTSTAIVSGTVIVTYTNSGAPSGVSSAFSVTVQAVGSIATQGTPTTLYAPAGASPIPYTTAEYFDAGIVRNGTSGWGCTFSATGLPAGFHISSLTGTIRADAGVSASAGTYSATVTATHPVTGATGSITVPIEVYTESITDVAADKASIEAAFAAIPSAGGVRLRIADGTVAARLALAGKIFAKPVRVTGTTWSYSLASPGATFYSDLNANAVAATFGFKCEGITLSNCANVIVEGVESLIPNAPGQTGSPALEINGTGSNILGIRCRLGATDLSAKVLMMCQAIYAQETGTADKATWDSVTGGITASNLRNHPTAFKVEPASGGAKNNIWAEWLHTPWGGRAYEFHNKGGFRKVVVDNWYESPVLVGTGCRTFEKSHFLGKNVWSNSQHWSRHNETQNPDGPHSNSAGSFDGGIDSLYLIGNISTGGSGMVDFLTAQDPNLAGQFYSVGRGTGPKMNDNSSSQSNYSDILSAFEIYPHDSTIGFEFEGARNVEICYMTLPRQNVSSTPGSIYLDWASDFKIWRNRFKQVDKNDEKGASSGLAGFGNVILSDYSTQFAGNGSDFEDTLAEDIYDVFNPVSDVAGYTSAHTPGSDDRDWPHYHEEFPQAAAGTAQTYAATVRLGGAQRLRAGRWPAPPADPQKILIRARIKPDYTNFSGYAALIQDVGSRAALNLTTGGGLERGVSTTAGYSYGSGANPTERVADGEWANIAIEMDFETKQGFVAVNGVPWGLAVLAPSTRFFQDNTSEAAAFFADPGSGSESNFYAGDTDELTIWATTTGGLHTSAGLSKVFTSTGEFRDIGAAGDATLGVAPLHWVRAGDEGWKDYGTDGSGFSRNTYTVGAAAPTITVPSVDDGYAGFTVPAPEIDPDSSISAWSLRYSDDAGSTWTEVTGLTPGVAHVITGLSEGDYLIQREASNGAGSSGWSTSAEASVLPPYQLANLFAGSEVGDWWDTSVASSMTTDTGGTTPATTGQAVARISGGEGLLNFTQSTLANQPDLAADGDLVFNGTSDRFATAVYTPASSIVTFGWAGVLGTSANPQVLMEFSPHPGQNNNAFGLIRPGGAGDERLMLRVNSGGEWQVIATVTGSAPVALIAEFDNSKLTNAIKLWINGTEATLTQNANNKTTTGNFGAYKLNLAKRENDTFPGAMQFAAGFIVNRALTSDEIAGATAAMVAVA